MFLSKQVAVHLLVRLPSVLNRPLSDTSWRKCTVLPARRSHPNSSTHQPTGGPS